jgi:hypothetical protein
MEQGIDHQRVGIALFGQANLGRAKLSHAFGVESAPGAARQSPW